MYSERPIFKHFLVWLLFLPVFFIEHRAFQEFLDERSLHNPARYNTTTGIITGMRTGDNDEIQVRYSFYLNGNEYSATDMTGRKNLWIPIQPSAWQKAGGINGELEIVYLPDKPWVNEPLQRAGMPVGDSLAGWVLFLMVDTWSIFELGLIVKNYTRVKEAAENRQVLKLKYWETREIF